MRKTPRGSSSSRSAAIRITAIGEQAAGSTIVLRISPEAELDGTPYWSVSADAAWNNAYGYTLSPIAGTSGAEKTLTTTTVAADGASSQLNFSASSYGSADGVTISVYEVLADGTELLLNSHFYNM